VCTIPAVAGNKRRCYTADWVAVDSKAFAFAFAFAVAVVVVVAMDASSVAGGYSYSQAAAAVDIAVAGATGKDTERRWVAVAAAVDSCMTPAEWKKASHSFVRVL